MNEKITGTLESQIRNLFKEFGLLNYWRVSKTEAFFTTQNKVDKKCARLITEYNLHGTIVKYQYAVKIKDDKIVNPCPAPTMDKL